MDRSGLARLLRHRVEEREMLLERVRQVLGADPRVAAAWLSGSAGRGDADAFSDLDVVVVVADDQLAAVAGDPMRPASYGNIRSSARGRSVAAVAEPLLLLEAPQNAPPGGAFLSSFFEGTAGPQGIDWVWQPESTGRRREEEGYALLDRRRPVRQPPPSPYRAGTWPAPPRTPLESAVQATCSFWSMLLWSGKGVARFPAADGMPLLRYATEALDVVDGFLDTRSAPARVRNTDTGTGAAKVRVLRELSDHMTVRMPGLLAAGVDVPPAIAQQVDQYLRLVDHVVTAG